MTQQETAQYFARIYENNFDKIFHYILKRTQDLAITQDITSETFYKAVRYLKEKSAKIEKMENWLYTIATNEIKQHYRKNKRIFFFSPQDFGDIPSYETPASELKKFEEEKEKKQELTHTLGKIKKLPRLDQDIIMLRFFEEKSTAEIAEILDKKPSTIRVRIHRLKSTLKSLLT